MTHTNQEKTKIVNAAKRLAIKWSRDQIIGSRYYRKRAEYLLKKLCEVQDEYTPTWIDYELTSMVEWHNYHGL